MDAASHASVDRLAHHGGRLGVARALHPGAPRPWVDLSTGINPRPYPAPRSTAAERVRLPDIMQLAELERTAAETFGADDSACVVALGGSELALRLLPMVLRSSAATIVGPTYSSHADAWRSAGVRMTEVEATDVETLYVRGGVVVVVNPNNPDGRLLGPRTLLDLHDTLATTGGALVVDEAFMDVMPEHSLADRAGSARAPQLVVLRSFGKFYGLAGVRLGFVIASPLIAEPLRGLIGDWPICADALAAGLAAYKDPTWARATRERLQAGARSLDALLIQHGFGIVGGTSLFRLAQHADAPSRFEVLLRAGILVRPFAHDDTLLRFGLPYGSVAWQRLTRTLSSMA